MPLICQVAGLRDNRPKVRRRRIKLWGDFRGSVILPGFSDYVSHLSRLGVEPRSEVADTIFAPQSPPFCLPLCFLQSKLRGFAKAKLRGRQITMVQCLVPTLKATHRLGSDFVIQADEPFCRRPVTPFALIDCANSANSCSFQMKRTCAIKSFAPPQNRLHYPNNPKVK
jgi:hypothetical protein